MNYPNLENIETLNNYHLKLYFSNKEIKKLDLKPFFKSEFFKEIENVNYFKSVKLINNVPTWPNGQDIAPETVYLDSIKF